MTDEQLKQQGYRQYAGEGIDVYYNIEMCVHAGNCVKGSIDVFNPKRKPWILPTAESPARVAEIIETCPSKALQYIMKEEK